MSSERTYEQSAVVPYRFKDGKIQILLISSRKRSRWVVPKGLIERRMTPAQSAAKEAFEEAGIRGKVSESLIGSYTYKKWGGTCRVQVYLMHVEKKVKEWPEMFRIREWVEPEEAIARVNEPDLKNVLTAACASLQMVK